MIENSEIISFDFSDIIKKYDIENQLKTYFDILKKENEKINLVSRETIGSNGLDILAAESLLPFEFIGTTSFTNYLDIGSGGGFPALPIVMSTTINNVLLVERTQKKAAALKRIIKDLEFESQRINVIDKTVEECSFDLSFDLITLRLVKLTAKLYKFIMSLLKKNGVFIYYASPDITKNSKIKGITYYYNSTNQNIQKSFTIFTKQ